MRTPALGRGTRALIVVAAIIALANAPYLLHFFDPNPLGPQSMLALPGTGGLLGGRPTIDPNIGYTAQALGHLAALDWLHLRVPWWNPYEGSGTPLAGEMQSAAMFVPTLLLALADGQLYEHVLLELAAGFATYLLLRRIAVGRPASAAGAIVFALNGTFAWFGHAAVNPVALLPLLLLGLEFAYAATVAGRRGGYWLIALALALSVYAGFPETAYVDGLLAVGWFVWRAACVGPPARRQFAVKTLAGTLLGGLLAAPIIVAFAALLEHGTVGAHAGAAGGHLAVAALPQLVLPYVYGSIFEFHDRAGSLAGVWGGVGGYLSVSLVVFGALGLVSPGRRGLRLVLGLWLVLALSRMYGVPGVGQILGVLPGMSSVVFSRYATPSVAMAASVLLALGLDDLARDAGRRRRLILCGLVGLAVVGGAALGARGLVTRLLGDGAGDFAPARERYFWIAAGGGAVVVILGAAVGMLRNPRLRTRLACGVVVLESVALFALPQFAAPRTVHTDLGAVAYLRGHLGLARFATLGPIQPNYGAYFGLAGVNDDDAPIPAAWADYVHRSLDPVVNPLHFIGLASGGRPRSAPSPGSALLAHLDGYRAAGVAYLVTPAGARLNAAPLTKIYAGRNATIYHLAGADPYFTTSGSACGVESEDRQAARVACRGPATLVRRETYLPGWTARVDGHAVALHEVDGIFQAVGLGAGSHRVSFSYVPPGMRAALVAFLAGLAWLVIGSARWRLGRPPGVRRARPG